MHCLLYLALLILSIATPLSEAKIERNVVKHHFDITYGSAAPDCFLNTKAILINGQFPGPTIIVGPFDTLVVKVCNLLDHVFAMHWHGLHQRTSKNADGVPGVTQEPIPPNKCYKYVININGQHGTFAYHSHVCLDIIWALGVLIINDWDIIAHDKRYHYDHDVSIVPSQCWHRDVQQLCAGLSGTPLSLPPPADSILINGRSHGVWPQNNSNCDGYSLITVEQYKIYRFRFIGFGDDRAFVCNITGHKMKIIEIDGTICNIVVVDYLFVNILQRYSVLIFTDQPIGNYFIKCYFIPGAGPDNGVAILHYKGAPNPTTLRKNTGVGTVTPSQPLSQWVLPELYPMPNQRLVYDLPKKFKCFREIVIKSAFVVNQTDGSGKFTINGESLDKTPPVNYLSQVKNGVNISGYPAIYTVPLGCYVLVVFQNLPLGPFCAQHPFHMHGVTFYVVAYGPDCYDPIADKKIIEKNIKKGKSEFRDVVTLFPNTTQTANITCCGWVAILFYANNPGVWLTHCHISDHMLLGKQFCMYITDYKCEQSGTFHDPSDCKKYIPCVRNNCGGFKKMPRHKCPNQMFYNERKYKCDDQRNVPECREQVYQDQYSPHEFDNPYANVSADDHCKQCIDSYH